MIKFSDFKFRCHWKDIECPNNLRCDGCDEQPSDDEKPNGRKDPVKIGWEESYGGIWPVCPSCGEMPYSTDRCTFCGQKFIQDEDIEAYNEPPEEVREDCFFCGGEKTVVGTRARSNGHFRGVCEKCGCIVQE